MNKYTALTTFFVTGLIPFASGAAVQPLQSQAGATLVKSMGADTLGATKPNASLTSAPAAPAPAYLLYKYYGDRYRDPFVPLIGEARPDQFADHPPQVASLSLKGIVQDSKGRMALLTSGVSSYILRGGRLYDGRNHVIKGISGVIKSNSVILIGADHTVRELRVTVAL